ncbi:MAG: sigma-54 interaction domain-containing protein [Elusimicrobiota bacterium]
MINDEIRIIGESKAVKRKLGFINKVANSDKNVLIWGETGTGKNLTAKMIHKMSHRKNKPFISVNCSNIPEELFEAELFGYRRGAFTGAHREKVGLLEFARGGTVFLDEIGDLSLHFQAKILKTIEEKELRRIGDMIVRRIHARFIFATNKDLQEEVRGGKFRKDLYYRINVIRFYIPSLMDRKEDIPLLAKFFLGKENRNRERKRTFSKGALKKLMAYDFPGNIRELENIIERAYLLSEKDAIDEEDIVFDPGGESSSGEDLNITPDRLRSALEKCRWNKTRAATEIGKSRRQFYRLLEKHQMTDCIKRN